MILFLGIFLSACDGIQSHFRNKVLVYGAQPPNGEWKTLNARLVDYYMDTLNMINHPLNFTEQPYQWSHIPFKFIFIPYTKDRIVHLEKYFSVSKMDSIETSAYQYLYNSSPQNVITRKLDNDTTMKIGNKRIKCWAFFEKYPDLYPPVQEEQIIYIEKKTLLPVQITSFLYTINRVTITITDTSIVIYKIDSVFASQWTNATKPWKYPKFWQ